MPEASPGRSLRSQHAARVSWDRTVDRSARTAPARAARKAARLEEHIRRAIDAAPPLSDTQREKLASLLRGSATPNSGGGAAA